VEFDTLRKANDAVGRWREQACCQGSFQQEMQFRTLFNCSGWTLPAI